MISIFLQIKQKKGNFQNIIWLFDISDDKNRGGTEKNGRHLGFSVRPVINESVNIILLKAFSDKASQTIYNIYGIKVDGDNLKPSVYIQGGKKYVVK